ncbi:PLD-like domain-containing protein [Marinitoga hydrogenitolerans DSM 16785]|uniref:phospholipase D n=1 Tax=Marinitoga hydrogenitolerans (strain DSM 16785 / JCM 12826 / AT1271) TaxID=1122195 RepID=A0A1M4VBL8_MARH1|nr:phospholipase D-like domain-containing protein [Marinitoga hydrogenitolerans]SHE66250.1 PLD-like domain-containing protein [Marinitoga hydrogenitolerans DSM 16785]
MYKFFILIFILFAHIIFSYEIFITPSYKIYNFIKEKTILSDNLKFASLSINSPFLELLDTNKSSGYIEYENLYFKSYNILPDKNLEGYLHEKFIIFDNNSVLFGTGNFTKGSIFEDLNIFIYSEDKNIVSLFLKEFDNFKNGNFGKNKRIIDKVINSKDLGKVVFVTGPSENIFNVIDNFILSSKKILYIFTFSFTDNRILYNLEYLSSKNIDVKIIADNWNIKNYSNLKYLKSVKYTISKKYRNMHLKVLINENGVLLGSYNLTYRAREKNDEFIIILYNKNIQKTMLDLFNKLWSEEKYE